MTATAARALPRRRSIPRDIYATGVGKKYVMAVTGMIGIGFVIAHMIGNLKMYLGPITEGDERVYDIDVYGEFLRAILVPILPAGFALWGLRAVLVAAVALHIHAAWGLSRMNRNARSVKYLSSRDYQVASFASRTMRWSGIIVGLFIVWHLADLTWGVVTPGHVPGGAYYNIDRSLSRWPVAALYIVANLALGLHLFHGTWSLFQSMGWNNPHFNRWRRNLAVVVAAAVTCGNVSFPIAVLAGVVEYDPSAVTEPIEDSTT
ncbi:succinate dehydrogenase cytochrome b subunit [Ilumatobacter sp.]|uniref:succinate dehydrogenase cytochrome b subunit n=1 Tax=Ilumatobacter sp. TaxID=1967498 RepID=UPI003B5283E5